MTLIIVMSVMNGFRAELLDAFSLNGHLYRRARNPGNYDEIAKKIKIARRADCITGRRGPVVVKRALLAGGIAAVCGRKTFARKHSVRWHSGW